MFSFAWYGNRKRNIKAVLITMCESYIEARSHRKKDRGTMYKNPHLVRYIQIVILSFSCLSLVMNATDNQSRIYKVRKHKNVLYTHGKHKRQDTSRNTDVLSWSDSQLMEYGQEELKCVSLPYYRREKPYYARVMREMVRRGIHVKLPSWTIQYFIRRSIQARFSQVDLAYDQELLSAYMNAAFQRGILRGIRGPRQQNIAHYCVRPHSVAQKVIDVMIYYIDAYVPPDLLEESEMREPYGNPLAVALKHKMSWGNAQLAWHLIQKGCYVRCSRSELMCHKNAIQTMRKNIQKVVQKSQQEGHAHRAYLDNVQADLDYLAGDRKEQPQVDGIIEVPYFRIPEQSLDHHASPQRRHVDNDDAVIGLLSLYHTS